LPQKQKRGKDGAPSIFDQSGGSSQEQNADERARFEAVGVFGNDQKAVGTGEGD
jgi:hypothetical protein